MITHELGEKFVVNNGKLSKRQNLQPIPDDEPVFILRARDRLALKVLRYFDMLCREDGATEWQLEANKKTLGYFDDFRRANPELMKQPGITRGK